MSGNGSSGASAPEEKLGELGRLKVHSAATIEELREFLAKMRGKSPQEVLGMVASSNLLKATAQATFWSVLLMVVTTIGPYALNQAYPKPKAETAQKPQPAAAAPVAPTAPAPAAQTEPAEATKKADAGAKTADTAQSNLEKAAKKMGMDETKTADPKTNPLEPNLDKLLDKLD